MTLFKRHIGRRVVGVGVAAALLVLGLEAPAFAVAPTITSFTPTSGPAAAGAANGCVVTITGTNFTNPNVTAVDFNGTAAASFTIVSGIEIRAEVATGTTTGPVHVVNADGTGTGGTFTIASPGGCAPTITSFTPTCGPVGTSVTITGTNLFDTVTDEGVVKFNNTTATITGGASPTQISAVVPVGATTGKITVTTDVATATSATDFTVASSCVTITSFTPTSGPVGTKVKITGTGFTGATAVSFNNVNATTFTVDSATQITATVPTGATTGKIKVTAPAGTATSATDFTVTLVTVHSRSVTLRLRKHLIARGKVSVGDGFTDCAASVPVRIQRRRAGGGWRTVKLTTTSSTGAYAKRIKDKPGKYRALAPKVTLSDGADVCKRDVSPVQRHRH